MDKKPVHDGSHTGRQHYLFIGLESSSNDAGSLSGNVMHNRPFDPQLSPFATFFTSVISVLQHYYYITESCICQQTNSDKAEKSAGASGRPEHAPARFQISIPFISVRFRIPVHAASVTP